MVSSVLGSYDVVPYRFFYQNFLNEMKWKKSEVEDLQEY